MSRREPKGPSDPPADGGQGELLRNLIASSVDGILAFDRECRYTVWNPGMERISGCSAEDTIGRVAFDVFPFLEEIGEDAFFHAALAGEDVIARDRPFTVPHTGKRGFFEGYYGPLRDERGDVVGGLAIIREVTERKELEEKLRQSQKLEAVGHLAGGIAHDFNNVLAGIIGWAEILLRGLPDDHSLRTAADEIKSCSLRAAATTQKLLTISRGDLTHPEVFDINLAVQSASGLMRRLIPEHIEIVLDLHASPLYVDADRGQLERALVNLTLNARDAMPRGGRVTIRTAPESAPTREPGSWVTVSVEDTGCGMDEETVSRIFDPFFTTKAPGKGTGLGLSTVYRAVEQASGQIDVRTGPGEGATFRLSLPRCPAPTDTVDEPTTVPTLVEGTERVLVVEDDPSVRRLMVTVLESAGYAVLCAKDGGEALDLAAGQREPVDLLLTDVVLPGLGGGAVAEKLTALWPNLAVLFMTGYSEDSLVEHRLGERLAALLRKPFSPAYLTLRVREILDRRSATPDR